MIFDLSCQLCKSRRISDEDDAYQTVIFKCILFVLLLPVILDLNRAIDLIRIGSVITDRKQGCSHTVEIQCSVDGLICEIATGCICTGCLALLNGLAPKCIIDSVELRAVTGSVDIRDIGLHLLVDQDGTVDFDTGCLCDIQISANAGGDDDELCRDCRSVRKKNAVLIDLSGAGGCKYPDARCLYNLLQCIGCSRIQLSRHKSRCTLDDRNVELRAL